MQDRGGGYSQKMINDLYCLESHTLYIYTINGRKMDRKGLDTWRIKSRSVQEFEEIKRRIFVNVIPSKFCRFLE